MATVSTIGSFHIVQQYITVVCCSPLSVPGAPLRVILNNIGPTTVRVNWTPDTLPSDNGGSPIHTVRLSYRQGAEGEWSAPVREDVGVGFYQVKGLMDQTTYQIRMEVGNDIGKKLSQLFCDFDTVYTLPKQKK